MNAEELANEVTWNIAALLIEPITIATPDGSLEVDALILGDWALNQNSNGWAVTHRKTGYAGKSFPTPIEAFISLGIYLGAGLKLPDSLTADTFQAIPDIQSIAARVKSAMAILDGWDLDIDYNEPDYSE